MITVRADGAGFTVELEDGGLLGARAVVAASGSFGRPHRPDLPGLETFAGQALHAADYRGPARFAGQRVVVVGAGNSAVQIAAELARESRTSWPRGRRRSSPGSTCWARTCTSGSPAPAWTPPRWAAY